MDERERLHAGTEDRDVTLLLLTGGQRL